MRILLWLFVINLGIAFGAGLYEHRIVVPDWVTARADGTVHWDVDAAKHDDTGLRFWAFVTTLPLTVLTFANLFTATRAPGPIRRWWLGAGLAALGDRLLTFGYFIPTMVGLMAMADSAEAAAAAMRWSNVNYLRHAFVLAAWLCALKALTLFDQNRRK